MAHNVHDKLPRSDRYDADYFDEELGELGPGGGEHDHRLPAVAPSPGMTQWKVQDAHGSLELINARGEVAVLVDGKFIIKRTTLVHSLAQAHVRDYAETRWQEAIRLGGKDDEQTT